ncbi:MAG: DUF1737 domain-containing protein [Actinomycetota bacterium]
MSDSASDSPISGVTGQAAGDQPAADRLRYRLLTGQDTAEFCQRVSDALDDGYVLHGSPTLIFDPDQGTRVAAQAVVLPDGTA